MTIKLYQIDAFAEELFTGNPAAVCLLDNWLPDTTMQKIAQENNLAETAFVVKRDEFFEIRWFTPSVEVDLCGHATLAAAFVLFQFSHAKNGSIIFYSPRSGLLEVKRKNEFLILDFPADEYFKLPVPEILVTAFSLKPIECFKGKTDYLLIFENEEQIKMMNPDLGLIQLVDARGVIVSAPGKCVDFVSRFFAPQSGIPEDPVTGSAHTTLTPYWSSKLKKNELTAMQLSKRTGKLWCTNAGKRIYISGKAKLYMTADIFLS